MAASGWLAFNPGDGISLVEGELGCIRYTPGYLDDANAAAAMDMLLTCIPWEAQRRTMYERDVAVPRLTAHLRRDDQRLPAFVAGLATRLDHDCSTRFDSVGLNLYRDGNDSVAAHNDRLAELAPGAPIALVSLGAPRTMVITTKSRPVRSLRLTLEAGSLLLMDWRSQHHYDHAIPKERHATGARISIAFRRRGIRGSI